MRRRLAAASAVLALGVLVAAPAGRAALLPGQGTVVLGPQQATAGAADTLMLGGFSDTADLFGHCQPASDYSASVSWGDGSADTAATINATGGGGGSFSECSYTLSAPHLYTQAGSDTITVTVTPSGASPLTGSATVTVADAALSAHPAGPLSASPGKPLSAVLATFTDANPYLQASEFAAAVNWGDGSATVPATVTATPGSGFQVSGTHTFTHTGSVAARVTIVDRAGMSSGPLPVAISINGAPAGAGGTSGLRLGLGPATLRRTSALGVRVACPTGVRQCRGAVSATLRSAHGSVGLAPALFFLGGGQRGTIDLLIPSRAQRLIASSRTLTASISAVAYDTLGGQGLTVNAVSVTLHRR